MKYILGVDGGNTKTDYYLFDTDGNFVDMYRGGTCSHECLKDSFDGSYRVMKEVFDEFLGKHNLKPEDIEATCMGLAGDDVPSQQLALDEVVRKLGFKNFVVVNDSMLGLKIGTSKGYGACSVNGTGTSASAVGLNGEKIQVGGIGEMTADEGGGSYISRRVVRKVWDECFRFDKHTSLTPITFNAFGITDKRDLMEAIKNKFRKKYFDYNVLTMACFDEANKGDEVARQILLDIGEALGRNAAGAIMSVSHTEHPEIVMVGSVYVKGACPILVEKFKETVNKCTGLECKFNLLQVPPATGAIAWAKEMYDGVFPTEEMKAYIIKQIEDVLRDK